MKPQYNTIQYNTIQYNTIQYNTIQYNTIQYNTIQYNTVQIHMISFDIGVNHYTAIRIQLVLKLLMHIHHIMISRESLH